MTVSKNDLRYPFTYADDYLRMKIGCDFGEGLISRSTASYIIQIMADAMRVNSYDVYCALADKYIKTIEENENE